MRDLSVLSSLSLCSFIWRRLARLSRQRKCHPWTALPSASVLASSQETSPSVSDARRLCRARRHPIWGGTRGGSKTQPALLLVEEEHDREAVKLAIAALKDLLSDDAHLRVRSEPRGHLLS